MLIVDVVKPFKKFGFLGGNGLNNRNTFLNEKLRIQVIIIDPSNVTIYINT